MNYDRKIAIATAGSRKSTRWPTSELMWSDLAKRLRTPLESQETLEEYLALSKSQQDELKDVGGFVGGTFREERRKANAVIGRDVLALDVDNVKERGTDEILQKIAGLGCGYCLYSTRKHHAAAPRLRILIPFDRTVSPDEYEPIGRKIAELAGILQNVDPTTFEASRFMYWASKCRNAEYVYRFEDKPFLSADGILKLFPWQDVSTWPKVPGEGEKRQRRAKIQKDPLEKKGLVGAFCRIYDIPHVISSYLAEQYEEDPRYPGTRYTYTGGSTQGGAVVYDGKFLYSHHATDPAGGTLNNSFDLVRIHLFNHLDDEAKPDTPPNRLPSYMAMCELALADTSVSKLLAQERYENALEAFSEQNGEDAPKSPPDEKETPDLDWFSQLKISKTGKISSTINNIWIILNHDPVLKGKMAFDEFSNRGLVLGALPWDSSEGRRDWADKDDAGLRQYLENVYDITGPGKIADALTNVAMANRFNDVQAYLNHLKWDGKKRIDQLLIYFFGADDTPYTRAVGRKFMCAAVARAFKPGIKFDTMMILVGPQGCGKTTFLRKLGKSWYTDSLTSFEGKTAAEIIQGNWIIELGELNAMRWGTINQVKQILSRSDDVFREAYGRRTGRFPRRCVFAGTTNDSEFLRDRTGNRRFIPVDLHPTEETRKRIFNLSDAEIDQLWAEAIVLWKLGEPLYLTGVAEKLAQEEQARHMESNPLEGPIREFLEQKIPPNWETMDLMSRRAFYGRGLVGVEEKDLVRREKVCAAEIWVECLHKDLSWMTRQNAAEINGILANVEGWERAKSGLRFGKFYGYQRAFVRSKMPETSETFS